MSSSRHDREAKALALWKSKDRKRWQLALQNAPRRAKASMQKADPTLDAFFYVDLPSALSFPSSSSSNHPILALDSRQLARVVEWKLARGTWRPRLLDFARAARATDVAAAAEAAAGALSPPSPPPSSSSEGARALPLPPPPPPSLDAVGRAIDALSELKGVGPATATALLSAADASVPFLSDEAGAVVLGSREYTRAAALRVTAALRERARELNEGEEKEKEGDGENSFSWTARSVERALWSASRAGNDDNDDGDGGKEEGEAEKEAKGEAKDKENASTTTAPSKKRRKR